MKRFLPMLPALALAACGTVSPPPPPRDYAPPPPTATGERYDARDFAWSTEAGANSVFGHVTYRTKASAYSCAGASIALTPATAYSARRTERLYGSAVHAVESVERVRARSTGEAPPPYADYVRSAKCDANGRFGFEGLPAGAWYLIARAKPVTGVGVAVVIMRRVETDKGAALVLSLH